MKIPTSLLEFCSRFPIPVRSPRSRLARHPLEFQKLEPRVLLAGDVTVFVDANFVLNVVGDDADNQVLIVGKNMAAARIVGLNGTTINGGESAFESEIGMRGLQVQMNGGNDEVDLHAGRFSFTPKIQGNGGDDLIVARNSNLGGLNIRGGSGNDIVEIDNVFAVNTSFVQVGSGDDMIAIYNHAAGDDIVIRGGSGADTLAIDRMGMFDRLDLHMNEGDDQVLVAGETIFGDGSVINLGAGNDFLGLLPGQTGGHTQVQDNTTIDAGAGNDGVVLDQSVSTSAGTDINGNNGTDGFLNDGASLNQTDVLNFENTGFDTNSALDEFYSQLAEQGLDPTLFGGSANFILGIDINPIALSYTENGPAIPMDPFLELRGASDTLVKSASVTITGFVANQDILEFSNVGSVTGVFDDATGILTFTGDGNLTQYQTALRSVVYRNSSEAPVETSRMLDIELKTGESATKASRTLNVFAVNDIPELNVRDTTLPFDIDNGDLQRPLALDPNLTLTDIDTPEFTSAAVQIVGGAQPGDTLAFDNANGITGVYDPLSGLLTLSGTATVDVYEKALRTVTFDNTQDRASLGLRTIQFETTDGQTLVADQLSVDVVASQTIVVNTSQSTLDYEETADPTPVDLNVTLSTGGDPLAIVDGATVSIISGLDASQDELSFDSVGGITGSYNSTTGVLLFTGSTAAEDYQKLLRTVTFFNSSFGDFDFSTSDRIVEFAVQRESLTATATRTIQLTEITSEQDLIQRYLVVNNMTSQVTGSGLHYIVKQEGNGNFPNQDSIVVVKYVGTLLNGEEFDSGTINDPNSGRPPLPLTSFIPGWIEGIPKFSEGGSGILLIPSNLAYGESPPTGSIIPPNAILTFEIELISFV